MSSGIDRTQPGLRRWQLSGALVAATCGLALGLAACGSSGPSSATKTANADIQAGLSAQSTGNIAKAIAEFNAAAAADPSNAIPYYDLGVMYTDEKNTQQASTEYEKALLANADYTPALYNLAILETPTNASEAEHLYGEILALHPNDADTNFNLGLLLYDQGQQSAGIADIDRAISVDPSLRSRVPSSVHL